MYHLLLLLFYFSASESQASLGFGIVTVIAGLVGTISGSELSKFISRWTDQADCIVCAIGLLVGSPMMYFAITFGAINIYLGWVRQMCYYDDICTYTCT